VELGGFLKSERDRSALMALLDSNGNMKVSLGEWLSYIGTKKHDAAAKEVRE